MIQTKEKWQMTTDEFLDTKLVQFPKAPAMAQESWKQQHVEAVLAATGKDIPLNVLQSLTDDQRRYILKFNSIANQTWMQSIIKGEGVKETQDDSEVLTKKSAWSTWRMYRILYKGTDKRCLQFGSYKTRARNKGEAARKARANTDVVDFTMLEESEDAFKKVGR